MLKECLFEYRKITENIIEQLKNDNLDEVEQLVSEREKFICELKHMDYDKNEFIQFINEFAIMELEEKMKLLHSAKREEYKKRMIQIKNQRKAHSVYSNAYNKSYFLREEI